MYIFRCIFGWLMKHPMLSLAAYLLVVGALLLNMFTGSGSSDDIPEVSEAAKATEQVETAEMKDVDLSVAPKLDPSTLTTALVTGAEGETAETNTIEDATIAAKTEVETEATGTESTTSEVETTVVEAVDTSATVEAVETNTGVETSTAAAIAVPVVAAVVSSSASGEEKSEEIVNDEVVAETTTETQTDSEATTEVKETVETTETETAAAETTTEVTAAASETALDTEFSEVNPDEMLLMAREAYWNNGLDESAQIYQELIQLKPEIIEYRGELGNVFWRQGYPKKAAELYASIALPMIDSGNSDRVANMVGFIGLYYPEKATEIHNRLQAEK